MTFTLTAPESYGIDAGQPLILHGVQVGQVIERTLSSKGVSLPLPSNRSIVTWCKVTVSLWSTAAWTSKSDLMAWSSLAPAPASGSAAAFVFCPDDKGEMKKSYPLYATWKKRLKTA
ncbi:hypothetical protein ACNKHK_08800 [Shigella flexneri]